MKYKEIQKLHKFCLEKGIAHEFSELYDGYKILFYNGEDCVQHEGTNGVIEFWLKERVGEDILRMNLEDAKKTVLNRYYHH